VFYEHGPRQAFFILHERGVIQMKRFKRLKLFLLLLVFFAGLLGGCGRGGGGGDGAASPNPAEGSTWDQMEWDKGKWG
jgi:hypothetical protein